MFEALSDRLSAALKKISGRGVLRPEDVDAGLREVRLALLEADVNFKVVKEFVDRVRSRLVGVEVSPGLTAPQQVVKAVDAELVELLGGNSEGLRYASAPPTTVMLVGRLRSNSCGRWPSAKALPSTVARARSRTSPTPPSRRRCGWVRTSSSWT